MRVLKYFWTCLLQACSYQAVFHNYLNGLCSPSLVISLGLLSLSWSSFPLLWRILICILIIKVKLKASSDSFPWLFLLFTDCIVWNISAVSKMGLGVSLGDICFWRPLILFCPHEMSMAWPAAAWSKITFIQQNNIVPPFSLKVGEAVGACSDYGQLSLWFIPELWCQASLWPLFSPLPGAPSPFFWCWCVWRALSCSCT